MSTDSAAPCYDRNGRLTALFPMPMSFTRILLFTLLLALTTPAIAATAEGTVFEDTNGNQRFDPGEPGIAGVRVSNGDEIVLTDPAGRYRIEIDKDEAIVFVVKPAGYKTPVNALQIPQFYYIHQPAGSPTGLRYPGIAPTGPLPESIDFPLYRDHEPSRFRALLIADPQPRDHAELDYLRDDVIGELLDTDAKFGLTLGDIMFDDLSLFERSNAMFSRIGIPWYNVPGNHDINFGARSDRHSLETFKRHFGPPYYSFEYGETVFFVLDNIDYRGRRNDPTSEFPRSGGYRTKFGRKQLAWLAAELAQVPRDRLLIFAMHAPLETYLSADAGVLDRDELFKLVANREHVYAIAGHTHTTEHHYFDAEDSYSGSTPFHHHVLTTASGSWWNGPQDTRGIPTSDQRDGTPNGYHVLTVDGTQFSTRYKAAGFEADYQMRITFAPMTTAKSESARRIGENIDGRMSESALKDTQIVVNLFDGGPHSRVTVRIGEREPIELTRVFLRDPYMLELQQALKKDPGSWARARNSSHLFSAPLPRDLRPGTYRVSVSATDEFNQTHHAHSVLEIAPDVRDDTTP